MQEPRNASQQQMLYQAQAQTPEVSRTLLKSLHEMFARDLGVQLSAYLRTGVNVRLSQIQECGYSAFLAGQNKHSCTAVLTLQPQGSQLLFELDAAILFPLLELMLGAKPASRPIPDRAPTEIEKQLLAILIRSIAGEFERTINTAAKISLQLRGIENQSYISKLFPQTENVIAAMFEMAVGERNGIFTILSPSAPFDSLLEGSEGDFADAAPAEADVSSTMLEAGVQLDVWMTDISMALQDLMQLREGYVIKFDHPTERRVSCTLNGADGFRGQVVSTGRKRALLIEEGLAPTPCVSG
jgi:flagellar motor switch protein FliM